MKKILILSVFAGYCHLSNAQSAVELVTTSPDTTVAASKAGNLEDRLNQQESEIKALKKEHVQLKKKIEQIQTALPNAKRNFIISRTGSKQLIGQ